MEINTPSPTSGPYCNCLYEMSTEIVKRFNEFPHTPWNVIDIQRLKKGVNNP